VHLALYGDPAQAAVADESLEDFGGAVHRLVVGRDHEIDTGVEMVPDLCFDDVRFVADEKCLDEFQEAIQG
jgi:hypothetical protein